MKNFTQQLFIALLSLISLQGFSQPVLNSYPSANATVYLDFNGENVSGTLWNGGMPITCTASGLTDDQITEIFNNVSEDFSPFNINITTDSSKFFSAPLTQRIRIIITPTSSWKANVAGVSYIGSFKWGDNTPGFVFCDRLNYNVKSIAECCSHESGHTLGLSHQSKYDSNCNLLQTYNAGTGDGETGWAPIMGNSYGKNMTIWNNGPISTGCNNIQDNLSIITGLNGFSYKEDEYSDSLNNADDYSNLDSVTIDGMISTNSDKDVFKFSYNKQSNIHFEATPHSDGVENRNANLDIKISIYNETNTLIRTYNPLDVLNVTVDTILAAGSYYFVIEGAGNNNTSNYGSIGTYQITTTSHVYGIHQVSLSGNLVNSKDDLNWNIISDNSIKSETIEYSNNGIEFNSLLNASSYSRNFSYVPQGNDTRYYRLKVESVTGEIAYSNVTVLRTEKKASNVFIVPTMVNSQAMINATEDYSYRLLDVNGRLIETGRGNTGSNYINMSNKATGMYFIELKGRTTKEIKRIIKQ